MSESNTEIQRKWSILGWEDPQGHSCFCITISKIIKICSKIFLRGKESKLLFFKILCLNSLSILILPQQKINSSWELEEGKEGKENAWGFFQAGHFPLTTYSTVIIMLFWSKKEVVNAFEALICCIVGQRALRISQGSSSSQCNNHHQKPHWGVQN